MKMLALKGLILSCGGWLESVPVCNMLLGTGAAMWTHSGRTRQNSKRISGFDMAPLAAAILPGATPVARSCCCYWYVLPLIRTRQMIEKVREKDIMKETIDMYMSNDREGYLQRMPTLQGQK